MAVVLSLSVDIFLHHVQLQSFFSFTTTLNSFLGLTYSTFCLAFMQYPFLISTFIPLYLQRELCWTFFFFYIIFQIGDVTFSCIIYNLISLVWLIFRDSSFEIWNLLWKICERWNSIFVCIGMLCYLTEVGHLLGPLERVAGSANPQERGSKCWLSESLHCCLKHADALSHSQGVMQEREMGKPCMKMEAQTLHKQVRSPFSNLLCNWRHKIILLVPQVLLW